MKRTSRIVFGGRRHAAPLIARSQDDTPQKYPATQAEWDAADENEEPAPYEDDEWADRNGKYDPNNSGTPDHRYARAVTPLDMLRQRLAETGQMFSEDLWACLEKMRNEARQ